MILSLLLTELVPVSIYLVASPGAEYPRDGRCRLSADLLLSKNLRTVNPAQIKP